MFRILPFLIVFLFILVFSKTITIFEYIPSLFSIATLNAQNTTTPQPAVQSAPSNTTPKVVHEGAKPMEVPICGAPQFSPTELEVLENLSKRREQLQERDNQISLKENLLKVTEQRVEQKISALQNLMTEAQKVIDEYNHKQNQEILTLVKIYENMKPKDAARIFDELQMPILVEVCSKMNGTKLAPILALMDSSHAKDLTIELANRRKIDLRNFN